MSELSALGIPPSQETEWREFFSNGRVHVSPLDAKAARRRVNANLAVLIATAGVVAASVLMIFAIMFLNVGGPVTAVLFVLLALAGAVLFIRFLLTRRRLRTARVSSEDYLVVSREGLRIAGHVDVPWTCVIGGVGFDDRDGREPLLRRPAAAVERAAGVVRAEFVLGVRGVRALRDGAPRDMHGIFEVISTHGGIRIPIDTMVPPDRVRATLAAICIAARLSGVDVEVTADRSRIYSRTLALLGPEKSDPPVAGA